MRQNVLQVDAEHTKKLLRGESIAVRFKAGVPEVLLISLDNSSLPRIPSVAPRRSLWDFFFEPRKS